jgi:hypothetical protein
VFMTTITETGFNFKVFERNLFEEMCREAVSNIQEFLAECDKTIMAERDTTRYRYVNRSKAKTVKTVFGEVAFTRRYYYDYVESRYVFLLDETLGIFNGCGQISGNLADQIVHECADKSFRKAAESISTFTGQSITAQGAWGVLQRYGDEIAKQEDRLAELEDSGSVGHLGAIPAEVLFVEHDEVWISRQGEKRRAPGSAAKGAKRIGRKLGKKPMCVGIAYTGCAEKEGGRHNTVDKIAYASFGGSRKFRIKFGTLLNHRYDMDGNRYRITNGDGESWIRTEAEENDSILQLNPFHRSKAITKAVSNKAERKLLFDAVRKKDIDDALGIICELYMDAYSEQDEKSEKRLKELYDYFNNNKDILLTWQERGIELPEPPEGIVYRELGAQESNNCIYTGRMKHWRGAWSEGGGDNMARILSYRSTIGLDAIFGTLPEPEPIVDAYAEPLSAAQSPKSDGKKYGGEWLRTRMPFVNTFKTNGREAIMGLLRTRPLSGRIH